jgi:hypothetical protein
VIATNSIWYLDKHFNPIYNKIWIVLVFYRNRKLNGQSRMDNHEWTITNGQFRDTGNIGHEDKQSTKDPTEDQKERQTNPTKTKRGWTYGLANDKQFLFLIRHSPCYSYSQGIIVVVIAWLLDLQLPVQSVPISSKVVSSSPDHSEVYSIQHYVIKFISDLRQVGGFLRVLRFPPPIKLTITI